MNKRASLVTSIAAGLLVVGGLGGFALKALADGIPSPSPLYYSGTLTEGGSLVDGTRAITVNLWQDGTTAGTPICQTVASTTPVTAGRFRIALASACKSAVNQNPDAFVEVIDGATSLGRTPIGAVPYAVEADHAVNATSAAYAVDAGHAAIADNATTAVTATAASGSLASTIAQVQAQVHAPSAFHARMTAPFALPTDTTMTVVFDRSDFDLQSEYSVATGTFTPEQSGYYLVDCGLDWEPANTMGYYTTAIWVDGSEAAATDNESTGSGFVRSDIAQVLSLTAGDSVQCTAWQNSGVTEGVSGTSDRTTFGATRIY